jgi:hypothetical protein
MRYAAIVATAVGLVVFTLAAVIVPFPGFSALFITLGCFAWR